MALADRLIDATARRPAGWVARKTYGGPSGAPKGHEAVFDRVLDAVGSLEDERCLELGSSRSQWPHPIGFYLLTYPRAAMSGLSPFHEGY